MAPTTSKIIHNNHNLLFTHTTNKNANSFPLNEFTVELST